LSSPGPPAAARPSAAPLAGRGMSARAFEPEQRPQQELDAGANSKPGRARARFRCNHAPQ
jgi:hypothetical protein